MSLLSKYFLFRLQKQDRLKNATKQKLISHFPVFSRYVSIKPDHRKLINGSNVLGLLVDVLLKEGFHLVSTRTVSAEEKIECYCFERTRQPDALPVGQAQQGSALPRTKAVQIQKQK